MTEVKPLDGGPVVVCPICNGEGLLGYISKAKPPELADCYRCGGTGIINDTRNQSSRD